MRSTDNPDGDIEIAYTGLRPGEKIFEELLINPGAMATAHPRIWWLDEPVLPWGVLQRELSSLQLAMSSGYLEAAQSVLGRIVEEYKGAGQGAALDAPASEVQRKARLVH